MFRRPAFFCESNIITTTLITINEPNPENKLKINRGENYIRLLLGI